MTKSERRGEEKIVAAGGEAGKEEVGGGAGGAGTCAISVLCPVPRTLDFPTSEVLELEVGDGRGVRQVESLVQISGQKSLVPSVRVRS